MSRSSNGKTERLVLPGDPLAVIEEYLPGEGTYVDEQGWIRAAIKGVARFDVQAKRVDVSPARPLRVPKANTDAVGVVTQVRHDVVLVELYGKVRLQPTPKWEYEYSGRFLGAIPIANVSEEFVKDLADYYRPSDIVLVRVLNNTNPFHLTTRLPQYGVLYAECSRCGARLEPVSQREMKCPRCGHLEKRKVSVLASSRVLRIEIRRALVIPIR